MTTVRRKPTFTYQSPAQSTAVLHLETTVFTSRSVTVTPAPVPTTPPTARLSPTPTSTTEVPRRSIITHKSSRHHMTGPLLPLYHPFGTLALSLPDLDPTMFGLPAPVAVFDDPTRRASHRPRRPAAKVRDAEEPAPPSFTTETPSLETEVREKASPRRRRGGGPGGRRRRREAEDGDATYPAKRARHPRNMGVASGLTRAISREEGSPVLSNRTSPAVEGGREDATEEKKPERRGTRSRAAVRRSSTASEETATSGSRSAVSGADAGGPRGESSGEPNEGEAPGAETRKEALDDKPAREE